jgi:hypothetical protein
MKILKTGLLYFAALFSVGFVLGTIRVIWLVPELGTRRAELMEMPLMFVAIVLISRWIVVYFNVEFKIIDRLGMGLIAFILLIVTEFLVVLKLRNMTISHYLASRDPVSSTVYYIMLLVFAAMPLCVARK